MRTLICLLSLVWTVLASGCAVQVETFRDFTPPLQEFALSGHGGDKILIVPVRGVITTSTDEGLMSRKASVVQAVLARLNKAEKDPDIKALVLQVDSPGGTVVASDILYQELMAFRKRTGLPAVTLMMNVAASGGYEASLAGDVIVAHPATVTGSVGTLFIRPNVSGLMEMIGVGAEVTKSGKHKDIGSPFRESTAQERGIFQDMIDEMNGRFLDLVASRRGLDRKALDKVADARVYTAQQAKALGLLDRLGYAKDALAEARRLADLDEDASVVIYRRREFGDDTLYNTADVMMGSAAPKIDFGLSRFLAVPRTGFYYLWAPEYERWTN